MQISNLTSITPGLATHKSNLMPKPRGNSAKNLYTYNKREKIIKNASILFLFLCVQVQNNCVKSKCCIMCTFFLFTNPRHYHNMICSHANYICQTNDTLFTNVYGSMMEGKEKKIQYEQLFFIW